MIHAVLEKIKLKASLQTLLYVLPVFIRTYLKWNGVCETSLKVFSLRSLKDYVRLLLLTWWFPPQIYFS